MHVVKYLSVPDNWHQACCWRAIYWVCSLQLALVLYSSLPLSCPQLPPLLSSVQHPPHTSDLQLVPVPVTNLIQCTCTCTISDITIRLILVTLSIATNRWSFDSSCKKQSTHTYMFCFKTYMCIHMPTDLPVLFILILQTHPDYASWAYSNDWCTHSFNCF